MPSMAMKIAVAPSPRSRSASFQGGSVAMPSSRENLCVAERDAAALDHADRAFAGRRIEAHDARKLDLALGRRRNDRRGERMLARPLDAGRKAQHCRLVESRRRHDGDDLRLAFGQRAGLVDDQRVDLLHALERLGVLDQNAGLRAAADARP